MARRLRRLIKRFAFEEKNRDRIDLTDTKIRLNPRTNRLELAEPYTTDAAGATAETWVTNPSTVKQWLTVEIEIEHGYGDGGVQVTGDRYRLTDGADQYWWNGAAWEVNTSDWNTEAELANNLPTFPIAAQSLGVIVNLTTTDATKTPRLKGIKVLWASDIEFSEDLIYRSLVRALRDNVRPITDYVVQPGASTTTIDLANDFPLETPYNVVGVDAVYDHTDDPDHLVDLFDSYDTLTKVVTLSSALPVDHLAFIRLIYEPEVAVTTSQDFYEVDKVPSLILDDVNLVDASTVGTDDHVLNKDTGDAVKVPAPLQGDLEVTLHGITDKGVDHKRLADQIQAFFANFPTLRSTGLDEVYSLWLIEEYDARNSPGGADLHTGRARFRVRDVLLYVRDSVDMFGVKRFQATGTEAFTIAQAD